MALTISPPVPAKQSLPKRAEVELPEVLLTPASPWPLPYYLEDGLRRVWPYHFTYNTSCKERWRGRNILEVYADEFRDRPKEYYRESIDGGFIQLNGKKVSSSDTFLKNGDTISHTLHRHEPPVTAKPVGIVHEDEDIIVINKPAGVPVHPTGRYNYNSITEIMKAERANAFNPLPCNRLDRLTSGIMFIAKTKSAADRMTTQIMSRTIRKEYIARVKGKFPAEEAICEQPILSISPKLGLNRVRANGKEARTVFRRLAYYPPKTGEDGEGYSIVHCLPLTGRTHQIRVHLQFLGHPISNDPIYSNQKVFGPSLGKANAGGEDDDNVMERLSRMGKQDVAEAVEWHDEMVTEYNRKKAEKLTGKNCEICNTPLYSDPGPHELGIYLHAKKYACLEGKWSYESPMPDWASIADEEEFKKSSAKLLNTAQAVQVEETVAKTADLTIG